MIKEHRMPVAPTWIMFRDPLLQGTGMIRARSKHVAEQSSSPKHDWCRRHSTAGRSHTLACVNSAVRPCAWRSLHVHDATLYSRDYPLHRKVLALVAAAGWRTRRHALSAPGCACTTYTEATCLYVGRGQRQALPLRGGRLLMRELIAATSAAGTRGILLGRLEPEVRALLTMKLYSIVCEATSANIVMLACIQSMQ